MLDSAIMSAISLAQGDSRQMKEAGRISDSSEASQRRVAVRHMVASMMCACLTILRPDIDHVHQALNAGAPCKGSEDESTAGFIVQLKLLHAE